MSAGCWSKPNESETGGGRPLRARLRAAPAVPLRRDHGDARHAGGPARAYHAGGRADQRGHGGRGTGRKWFEKSPQFTDAQNHDQLRQALQLAIDNYMAQGSATPFGLYAGAYPQQIAKGAA